MCWNGRLAEGDDFDGALHAIVALLSKQGDWCRKFIVCGGEIDVTVNYDLDLGVIPHCEADDSGRIRSLLFDAELYPEFIVALSAVGAGMKLRVFGQTKT